MGTVFDSPGDVAKQDFQGDAAGYSAFIEAWTGNMRRWTEQAIVGNPWSNLYDDARDWYFDPTVLGWPAGAATPIEWTAFPNRLNEYFGSAVATQHNPTITSPLSAEQILELADTGAITVNGTTWVLYSASSDSANVLKIPKNLCWGNPASPQPDWAGEYQPFAPVGPRGWLDEYCEWAVERDGSGNPVRFEFTCENPDYWFTLWSVDAALVAELYRKFVNPAVALEDLCLRDGSGKVIVDETTGKPAYDPTNKWNRGTQLLATSGGAMHLSSPPNTIGAEIYLAAAGTIVRTSSSSGSEAALICCSRYGQPFRNSDPHIGYSANQVAVQEGLMVTLANPVGLYLQQPSWTQYTFPGGTRADDWYTVKRGHVRSGGDPYDQILHVTFAPPAGSGLSISDVTISPPGGGQPQPIRYAGQIAQTMQMALAVVTHQPTSGLPANPPRPCVVDNPSPTPWPSQLTTEAMAMAGSSISLDAAVRPGTTHPALALVADIEVTSPVILFSVAGLTASSVSVKPVGGTPGQTSSNGYAYVFDLTVAADVPAGDVGVWVGPSSPGASSPPTFAPGLLTVVA